MDPYEILGVSPSASDDVIRHRFYKLSREHHPDKRGDENQQKMLSEAYAAIKAERRGRKRERDVSSSGFHPKTFNDSTVVPLTINQLVTHTGADYHVLERILDTAGIQCKEERGHPYYQVPIGFLEQLRAQYQKTTPDGFTHQEGEHWYPQAEAAGRLGVRSPESIKRRSARYHTLTGTEIKRKKGIVTRTKDSVTRGYISWFYYLPPDVINALIPKTI